MNKEINVVIIYTNGVYRAQCLEHELSATSVDIPSLLQELSRIIAERISLSKKQRVDPWDTLWPSPQIYYDIFYESTYIGTVDLEPIGVSLIVRADIDLEKLNEEDV